MSLRARLVLLIVTLVTLTVLALTAVQLETLVNSLSEDAVDRADLAGKQVSSFLLEHISQHAADYEPAEDAEETKAVWSDIVAKDPDIAPFLQRSMALSSALIEINVARGDGLVLVSSNPSNVGLPMKSREPLSEWSRLPWHRRVYDLVRRRPDWEVSPPPIGIAGSPDPVFEIQILTSSVLVRNSLVPYLGRVAQVTGIALAVTLALTLLATHRILRPIQHIEEAIDRISAGSFQAPPSQGPLAKEFQAVESKLQLLGQQFRDARESSGIIPPAPANIGEAVERLASQLAVAKRLAAISRLSGGVAHEIKNPLNAILLRLDLLKARLDESDPSFGQELEVLSREVLRLDRVVKTFLDFTRPVDVRFEEVDLGALVQEVAELIKPQAALSHIEVSCLVPGEPARMSGDPDLLKQAVLNLVTNAVEAMPQGGQLRVAVDTAGNEWILEIADNGPGIPEDVRDKVFQLYFTTKSKGSGIGLAMTYRAVQLHNGSVSFFSEGGRGTTFRLAFPATVGHA